MSRKADLELRAAFPAPGHLSGMIQPHGCLVAITPSDEATASDAGERVHDAGARMGRTIDHVLKLSRSGRTVDAPETIAVDELLKTLAEDLGPQLAESNSRLIVAPDAPKILGDSTRIYTLFENLLTNAIKYAPGRIKIAHARVGAKVRSFVRDFGPGIPPDQHDAVFELFRRLSSDGRGDGVGLAITRKIVAAHRGRIWVESERGSGATFALEFPG